MTKCNLHPLIYLGSRPLEVSSSFAAIEPGGDEPGGWSGDAPFLSGVALFSFTFCEPMAKRESVGLRRDEEKVVGRKVKKAQCSRLLFHRTYSVHRRGKKEVRSLEATKGRGNSVAEALELCNDQIVRILAAKKFGSSKGRGGGLCRRTKMQISGQCRRATSARPCHRTTYIVHPHGTSKRDTRINPHLTPCLPTTRIVLVTPCLLSSGCLDRVCH